MGTSHAASPSVAAPPLSIQGTQSSLFATGAPQPDRTFSTVHRRVLGDGAWIEHAPGWLSGADTMLTWLVDAVDWMHPDVELYGKTFTQPRLNARHVPSGDGSDAGNAIDAMIDALSDRYGTRLDRVGANFYRDGRDSVAWHGDRVLRNREDALVATVSLGDTRRFLLRPRGGGRSVPFEPGPGDLIVMGGTCQRTWQHSIPKVAKAGPRVSITFRAVDLYRTKTPAT
jgi:alkylated DNA repair dioxygenase AlkB